MPILVFSSIILKTHLLFFPFAPFSAHINPTQTRQYSLCNFKSVKLISMNSRLIKPKALQLKDYLLDDMSSCSSNGFKSFPRRQCCTTTVRFLIEIDHKNKQHNNKRKQNHLNFHKTQPEATPKLRSALSALQSVIAAVKRLPFAAASSHHLKKKSLFVPRSLSVKILKKSGFWKRKSGHKEIGRWKSFDQLLKEDPEPSDVSISLSQTTTMTRSDGHSKSWSANDFTTSDECTSGNFPNSEVNMDLPDQVRNDAVELLKNDDVSSDSTTNSECSNASSTTTKQKQWSVNKEDKEQLSPISVMDFPFDDDDEVSSPFQRMEGTQKKVMKKMKTLGSLEPVSLAKQFELHLPNSSNKPTEQIKDDRQDEEADDDDDVEKQALNLLDQMDRTSLVPPNGLKTNMDRLLFDFFREKIIARDDDHVHSQRRQCYSFGNRELLDEAGNWINERKPRELFLGWEVSKNREAYIKDMDKTKEWRLDDQESCKEVAVELGAEVFDALLNELLLDISS